MAVNVCSGRNFCLLTRPEQRSAEATAVWMVCGVELVRDTAEDTVWVHPDLGYAI